MRLRQLELGLLGLALALGFTAEDGDHYRLAAALLAMKADKLPAGSQPVGELALGFDVLYYLALSVFHRHGGQITPPKAATQ